MSKPFTGIKVLDFTRVLAGPYGSYQLALLGADVVKVESREGDDMRYGTRANEWEKRGLAAPWIAVNAGKRSITLDLKKPKAIEIVKRLAAQADVVMENFRPGVMDKLGIGYETLKAINPRLIYCAVSGFGQVGPAAKTAAFDGMIQAMSGLMSITGFPQNGPTRVGFAGADVMSGATAALGVASALYQRTHTGKGQLVDVAMIDAVMAYLAQQFTEHMITGRVHEQSANLSVTRKPTGNLFKTRDGWIVLAVMTDPQFQRLMKVLGRDDALADPRFVDWPTRIQNNKALHEIVEEALKKETSAVWSERFEKADVPAGRVLSIPETAQLDLFQHRTVLQTVETEHGPIKVVGSGFRLEHGGGSVERPPATLGQHTDEVLGEAGYSPAEIAAIRQAQVV
ncbi:Crotonobetainyl-CoA:carnitine CoA-transferase CaiB [Enhydrobacter aerosaccus]|uniref:Crotonobetainyl-CoA:carnitine CoA-transferase CaiB n=1 Tax=Enhydrobacter aerosaccus TaxID=225324 RepID=A0A1T4QE36_9HYPH|nr:CoA transferase [Enhydrobacter aerosaccus]SKA02060.1 Crotonobetainyl-CoA:carnitine CoA-transferase CaiB [Enhydrobacter aerosaccus]